MALCPILQSGKSDKQVSPSVHYVESAECMNELCEWYEHGCPAHPVSIPPPPEPLPTAADNIWRR